MAEVYTVNRPAVLLYTIVGILALAYLFQHLFGEYLLWLAHRTPNFWLVNLQLAVPVATLSTLGWSARRRINRVERIFASSLLMFLGFLYIAISYWTNDTLEFFSTATGVSCCILSLALVVGEFITSLQWLLHPWSLTSVNLEDTVTVVGRGRKTGSCGGDDLAARRPSDRRHRHSHKSHRHNYHTHPARSSRLRRYSSEDDTPSIKEPSPNDFTDEIV